MLTSSICWISSNFSFVSGLTWLELFDHTTMSTSSMSWSSMTGSCVSTWLTWRTRLAWMAWLALLDLAYLIRVIWLDLVCSSDVFISSCVYIHISRRICDRESSSGMPSPGVIRNSLRENRLVNFCLFEFHGLCSIRLRRHGPFISCHVLLPCCFALSGTHLGSSLTSQTSEATCQTNSKRRSVLDCFSSIKNKFDWISVAELQIWWIWWIWWICMDLLMILSS